MYRRFTLAKTNIPISNYETVILRDVFHVLQQHVIPWKSLLQVKMISIPTLVWLSSQDLKCLVKRSLNVEH